jgi:hypothetical protein
MKLQEVEKRVSASNDDAFIEGGIMLWVGAVILLVVMMPVVNGIITGTPAVAAGSPLNATQVTLVTNIGSSYNLVSLAPLVIGAVVILGVVGLLSMRRK